jgi:DNA-binding winged helix-turn-helix (wHTH) protein
VCVREIRRALADDAAAPTYIGTVYRRGYRFLAPTEKATPPRPHRMVAVGDRRRRTAR